MVSSGKLSETPYLTGDLRDIILEDPAGLPWLRNVQFNEIINVVSNRWNSVGNFFIFLYTFFLIRDSRGTMGYSKLLMAPFKGDLNKMLIIQQNIKNITSVI